MSTISFPPTANDKQFKQWDIPAQAWSLSDWYDDSIRIWWRNGEWSACTRSDECYRHDLTQREIELLRQEVVLEGSI